jgi:hypothetical protein
MRNFALSSVFFAVLPLFFVAACAGDEKTPADDSSADADADTDADTDADSDADSDADTDADADTDTDPAALTTYEDFTAAQGEAFCAMLEACGMLDDLHFTDLADCVSSTTAHLAATDCPEYSEVQATKCIQAERLGAADCSTVTNATLPPCKSVCGGPPPAVVTPAASSASPHKK